MRMYLCNNEKVAPDHGGPTGRAGQRGPRVVEAGAVRRAARQLRAVRGRRARRGRRRVRVAQQDLEQPPKQ